MQLGSIYALAALIREMNSPALWAPSCRRKRLGYIEIDDKRCKGCELCVYGCPRQLIRISVRINHLGYRPAEFHLPQQPSDGGKGCTGCAVCGLVCPETAISVYR